MPTAIIVGVGCRKCHALRQLVEEIIAEQGIAGVTVQSLNPLEADPPTDQLVMPPALLLDGEVIVSGRVPNRQRLERVLVARLKGSW